MGLQFQFVQVQQSCDVNFQSFPHIFNADTLVWLMSAAFACAGWVWSVWEARAESNSVREVTCLGTAAHYLWGSVIAGH
ncbi:MAG: hypothetical protein IJ411_05980, partial [Oscillospiraceae bacterium]|nr:hypothetical protein [Oscillospiraceae bacterium]